MSKAHAIKREHLNGGRQILYFLDRGGGITRRQWRDTTTAVVICRDGGGDFDLFDSPLYMRFVMDEHVSLE